MKSARHSAIPPQGLKQGSSAITDLLLPVKFPSLAGIDPVAVCATSPPLPTAEPPSTPGLGNLHTGVTGEMTRLQADPAHIEQVLANGSARARAIAAPILRDVKKLVGFIQA